MNLGFIIGGAGLCFMVFNIFKNFPSYKDYYLLGIPSIFGGVYKYIQNGQYIAKFMIEYRKSKHETDPVGDAIFPLIRQQLNMPQLHLYNLKYFRCSALERHKKFVIEEDSYKFIQKKYDLRCQLIDIPSRSRGNVEGQIIYNHPESYGIIELNVNFYQPEYNVVIIKNLNIN